MNTRKIILIFLFGITLPSLAFGQTDSVHCISSFDTIQQRVVYSKVDSMPQFPGGNDSLMSFIVKNFEYPHHLPKSIVIFMAFTVEDTGLISNLRIYKGAYEPADNEALRVFKQMPNWAPGSCEGKAVPVQIIIPISLKGLH